MKISNRIKWAVMLVIAALFAITLNTFAQVPPPLPDVPVSGEAVVESPANLQTLVMIFIGVITPVVIWFVNWVFPKIPKPLLPLFAPGIGVLLDYLTELSTGHGVNIYVAAAAGFAGVGLREATNQTITKKKVKAVSSLILAAILCGSGGVFTGCQTAPTQESIQTYLLDARDIAELGTQAALLENTEFRDELETTRDALLTLAAVPQPATVNDLIAALSTLPLDQLQSDKGRIYVTGGRIILRRFSAFVDRQIDIGGGYVQQFAAAMADGMTAGLK